MSRICVHDFELEDSNNPGYSMTEYDLYADLGLTLRKNIREDKYEIMRIRDKVIYFSFNTLQSAVTKCNELEQDNNTHIECTWNCRNK